MEIPVYLFTGFLESGKTRFIQEMMGDDRFNEGEETLLLVFEEGEEEYRPEFFASDSVHIETVEDVEAIDAKTLSALEKKHGAKRVIVEYNGMSEVGKFLEIMPDNWVIAQTLMIADSNTFLNFNANMRQLTFDKMQVSEAVIFNRFDDKKDKMEFHKIVRGAGRRIDILYEYADGHVEPDRIPDPLPYDMNAPIVEIKDEDYAEFYRDLVEDGGKYEGKILSFKGIVAVDNTLPKKTIVVGRHIMTCCEADIAYDGFAVKTNGLAEGIKTREWLTVTAKINIEYNSIYRSKGPVLIAEKLERCDPPEERVVTYY